MSIVNQLALSLRPKRFSELIGQDKLVKRIQRIMASGRTPKGWLFYGPKGVGKTTIARILALSLQCKHQKKFGEPCDKCRKRKDLSIFEINCASIVEQAQSGSKRSAADAIRERLSQTSYELLSGKFRVYIFDEAHNLSQAAQDVCLKYFEDSPKENVFIINSTRPDKIVETLRSRCIARQVRPLAPDDIKKLVRRGLRYIKSDLSSEALTDALVEKHVDSGRLVLNAVELYAAGDSPEEAAEIEGFCDVDLKSLCRNVIKGDWAGTVQILRTADPQDSRLMRKAVVGYLREILFDSPDPSEGRTKALCKAIEIMSSSSWVEDINQLAVLSAQLAKLCVIFKSYTF